MPLTKKLLAVFFLGLTSCGSAQPQNLYVFRDKNSDYLFIYNDDMIFLGPAGQSLSPQDALGGGVERRHRANGCVDAGEFALSYSVSVKRCGNFIFQYKTIGRDRARVTVLCPSKGFCPIIHRDGVVAEYSLNGDEVGSFILFPESGSPLEFERIQ